MNEWEVKSRDKSVEKWAVNTPKFLWLDTDIHYNSYAQHACTNALH